MEEIVMIGKRNMYAQCLKQFLRKEIYQELNIRYFEDIRDFLEEKYPNNLVTIFVFEQIIKIDDFVELCITYGSKSIGIVTYNQLNQTQNIVIKKYQIEDFVLTIYYNQKDCFIDINACLHQKGRKVFLKLEDIYYIESYYGKIYFHTQSKSYQGKQISIYKYEAFLLDVNFIKIRKGCYVNQRHIIQIFSDSVILKNSIRLFFAKNYGYNLW